MSGIKFGLVVRFDRDELVFLLKREAAKKAAKKAKVSLRLFTCLLPPPPPTPSLLVSALCSYTVTSVVHQLLIEYSLVPRLRSLPQPFRSGGIKERSWYRNSWEGEHGYETSQCIVASLVY